MTRKEILRARAEAAGFQVSEWACGDGATRYRFHRSETDYFRAGGSRCLTAVGIAKAETIVSAMLFYRNEHEYTS